LRLIEAAHRGKKGETPHTQATNLTLPPSPKIPDKFIRHQWRRRGGKTKTKKLLGIDKFPLKGIIAAWKN
jgi:hypothetical protein